jgi:hypothetical protein
MDPAGGQHTRDRHRGGRRRDLPAAGMTAVAYAIGANPTQAVETFGLPRATAIRWIAKARESGYLGPAVKGRAGGPAPAGG